MNPYQDILTDLPVLPEDAQQVQTSPGQTMMNPVPAQRVPEGTVDPVQMALIQHILSTLQETPPQAHRSAFSRLVNPHGLGTKSAEEQENYLLRQQNAARGIAALNALSAMKNASGAQVKEAQGWARIALQARGLDMRPDDIITSGQGIDPTDNTLKNIYVHHDRSSGKYKYTEFGTPSAQGIVPASVYNEESGVNEYGTLNKINGQFTPAQMAGQGPKAPALSPPVHLGAYPGPGGEQVTFPTSPVPGAGPKGAYSAPTADNPSGSAASGAAPGKKPLPPRQAPAAEQEQANLRVSTLSTLQPLYDLQRQAHEENNASIYGSVPFVGPVVNDYLSGGQYSRNLSTDAVVDYNVGMRWLLWQFVKSQTGAQFSIKEMDQYKANFPTSVDDPARAKRILDSIAQQAISRINIAKKAWKGLVAPDYTPGVDPDEMPPSSVLGPYNQGAAADPAVEIFRKRYGRDPGQ